MNTPTFIPVLSLFLISTLHAEVSLPSIFGDHMVLQQGQSVPVWGKAEAGETVKVSFAGKEASATADAEGRWKVALDTLAASDQPQSFVVSAKNTVTFTDVVVGEVWVCSGQSNMVASTRNLVTKEVGDKKRLRFFITPTKAYLEPQETAEGKWVVCEPQPGFENPYSATGYYFAVEIERNRDMPVGMIQSAWGGTAIQPWIPLPAYEASDTYKKTADQVKAQRAQLPVLKEKYEKETLPAWEEKVRAWKEKNGAAKKADADASGEPSPGVEEEPAKAGDEPKRPEEPGRGHGPASAIYNGMVAPHVPYAIRGVIWYQGETNTQTVQRCQEYATLLPLMISGWRQQWGQGDFPFLIVQLPSMTIDRPWVELRNSQFKALAVPNTGLAVTLDLNPTDNLHPPKKEGVGQRLALLARKIAYGETLVASGPMYQSMKVEGDKVRVSFSETGTGLEPGQAPPAYRSGKGVLPPSTVLSGFKLCAADGKWVEASAEIQGNDVVVSSDAVKPPVHVSYAWDNFPKANLYNKEGLPAAPFRTDDLPEFLKK